jgi:hypothetical protein
VLDATKLAVHITFGMTPDDVYDVGALHVAADPYA